MSTENNLAPTHEELIVMLFRALENERTASCTYSRIHADVLLKLAAPTVEKMGFGAYAHSEFRKAYIAQVAEAFKT